MPSQPRDRVTFVASVSRLLNVGPDNLDIEWERRRLYSDIALVSVSAPDGIRRYLAKRSTGNLQRQMDMLSKASAGIDLPFFQPLAGLYDPDANLLVVDYFEGVSLEHLLLNTHLADPAAHSRLLAAFERAGAWLRAFHRLELADSDCRPGCRAYVENRMSRLCTFLDEGKLRQLVENPCLAMTQAALSHGDFTPQNILIGAGGRLTVVDFGISEWERMSPKWDLLSFDIGFQRVLHQSAFRRWRALLLGTARLRAAFWRGYGEAAGHGREQDVFEAMRHISFLLGHLNGNSWGSRAARWHRRALTRALDGATAGPG